jgi:DNA-binding IclR family transcriptional regulator
MTSLTRMLAILDLFDEGASMWTAEAITARLGYSLPTGYRYVRELHEAGLLRRGVGGTYVLGPRVIELDYRIRVGDPLLIAGQRTMRALADETGCDVVLGTLCGERIITIHQVQGTEGVSATYGRGRRMPLYRGMLSKAILSALPRAQLRKLYRSSGDEAQASTFSRDWDAMLVELKRIRAAGYSISHGELDPGLTGIAVPLTSAAHRLTAALGFVISNRRFATSDQDRLVELLARAVGAIVDALPQADSAAGGRDTPDAVTGPSAPGRTRRRQTPA